MKCRTLRKIDLHREVVTALEHTFPDSQVRDDCEVLRSIVAEVPHALGGNAPSAVVIALAHLDSLGIIAQDPTIVDERLVVVIELGWGDPEQTVVDNASW